MEENIRFFEEEFYSIRFSFMMVNSKLNFPTCSPVPSVTSPSYAFLSKFTTMAEPYAILSISSGLYPKSCLG